MQGNVYLDGVFLCKFGVMEITDPLPAFKILRYDRYRQKHADQIVFVIQENAACRACPVCSLLSYWG